MKDDLAVTAKSLKVHTGAILDRVAEGAVVYVTRRRKVVARIEAVAGQREEGETRALDDLIDELCGSLRDTLPASGAFARSKVAEERRRSRR